MKEREKLLIEALKTLYECRKLQEQFPNKIMSHHELSRLCRLLSVRISALEVAMTALLLKVYKLRKPFLTSPGWKEFVKKMGVQTSELQAPDN